MVVPPGSVAWSAGRQGTRGRTRATAFDTVETGFVGAFIFRDVRSRDLGREGHTLSIPCTLSVLGFPLSKARERVIRVPHRQTFFSQSNAYAAQICHRVPGCSLGIDHEPGILVDAIVRVHFIHRPTFLRACSKVGTETGFDRARESSWKAEEVTHADGHARSSPGDMELSESQAKPCTTCRSDLIIGKNRRRIGKKRDTPSPTETDVGAQGSAARSEEECGGTTTDGAGVSSKITGRATTVIAFHRENATLASAKKLLTMPKKFAEDDAVSLVQMAGRVAARLKRKRKGKDGEYPA